MAQGRCAGCGKTNASCKVMDQHIITCPQYIEVYKQDPSRALNPRDEMERWQRDENNAEAKAEAKDKRLAARFADADQKREVQSERWKVPADPLAD